MRRGIPQKGDVLITTEAPLGEVAILRSDEKIALAQRVILLRVNTDKIEPYFLYYVLQSPKVQYRIKARATGTTVFGIKNPELRSVLIPTPSKQIQLKIFSILSAYDDLIENNLRRIKLLEEAAQLIYKEWFVNLRFPGHEHTKIVDGIPERWNRKRLDEISDVNSVTLKKNHQGEIEYVDISAVTTGSINETVTYKFEEAPGRARRIVRHGDVIWSCVRPNRRSHAIVWNSPSNLIVSTGFVVLTPSEVPTTFLYFSVITDEFVNYLVNRARGAAYPAVTGGDFEEAAVIVPPYKLLEAFDEIIRPIVEQVNVLRTQKQKLIEARDLLLPRLMDGTIEV